MTRKYKEVSQFCEKHSLISEIDNLKKENAELKANNARLREALAKLNEQATHYGFNNEWADALLEETSQQSLAEIEAAAIEGAADWLHSMVDLDEVPVGSRLEAVIKMSVNMIRKYAKQLREQAK